MWYVIDNQDDILNDFLRDIELVNIVSTQKVIQVKATLCILGLSVPLEVIEGALLEGHCMERSLLFLMPSSLWMHPLSIIYQFGPGPRQSCPARGLPWGQFLFLNMDGWHQAGALLQTASGQSGSWDLFLGLAH